MLVPKLLVLSTFDILPAVDGGQTRYLSIYGEISRSCEVTILCYCIKSPVFKDYKLNENLRVIVCPAASADRDMFFSLLDTTHLHMHDVLCIRDYRFSPDFIKHLRKCVDWANIVIASHPYLAPTAFAMCQDRHVKVYESFNVELDVKKDYFSTSRSASVCRRYLAQVEDVEGFACREAYLVTAVSEEERQRLIGQYELPPTIVEVVPNGFDGAGAVRLTAEQRQGVREQLGIEDGQAFGVFLGSSYQPNVQAYSAVRAWLAQHGFAGAIAVIGSVCNSLPQTSAKLPFREIPLGFVDKDVKVVVLGSADFCLQMMFAGAGTNLKLFDYMASGGLIIANRFGARGPAGSDWFQPCETSSDLKHILETKPWDGPDGKARAARAREIAFEHYTWKAVAEKFLESILAHSFSPQKERESVI